MPHVVYRRGGRLYTTDVALTLFSPPAPDSRLVTTIRELTARVAELERRQDVHERERHEFQRQATARFAALEAAKTALVRKVKPA